jgi:hypothetical protein
VWFPERTADLLKLLSKATRSNALKQAHDLSRRKLGWRRDEQVDVGGHYFIRENFKTGLFGNFKQPLPELSRNRFN